MDFIKELSKFSAATLHEALGKQGNLPSGIKPIAANMKVCGPAYTVKTMPRDNVLLHRAYAYAKPGDVIVGLAGFGQAAYEECTTRFGVPHHVATIQSIYTALYQKGEGNEPRATQK